MALAEQRQGPYAGSRFFPARLSYSALHTCNTWTADALQAGGVPLHSAGVFFAWQLWDQLPQPDSGN